MMFNSTGLEVFAEETNKHPKITKSKHCKKKSDMERRLYHSQRRWEIRENREGRSKTKVARPEAPRTKQTLLTTSCWQNKNK